MNWPVADATTPDGVVETTRQKFGKSVRGGIRLYVVAFGSTGSTL
jgi:hypothetical protein